MMRRTAVAFALSLLVALPLQAQQSAHASDTRIDDASMARAAQLRELALQDDTGWKAVESLTTEVGPRLAGSEADARAVEWAKAKFKALGYDKVWTEPVTFPKWVRRSERADVLGAHAQPLVVTALGNSPGGTVVMAAALAPAVSRANRAHGRPRSSLARLPRQTANPAPRGAAAI